MKDFEIISKTKMATIIGGLYEVEFNLCLAIGEPCMSNIQCCSNKCELDNSNSTGTSCQAPD